MSSVGKVALFSNEYPPHVYGGAGVHVEYLSRELARLLPVEVRCFGTQNVREPNLRVRGYGAWADAKENTARTVVHGLRPRCEAARPIRVYPA